MAHQFQHIVHALSTDRGFLIRFLREPEAVLQSFVLTEEEKDVLLSMREEALGTAMAAWKAEGPFPAWPGPFPGWQGMELAEGPFPAWPGPFPGWQGMELAEGPFPAWPGPFPGWQGMELAEGPFPAWPGPFPGWQGEEPDLATSSI